MKKLFAIVVVFLALSAFTVINSNWVNDKAHSQLAFSIKHLGVSEVTGTFNDFDVNIASSKPDFSDAIVTMTAKIASIDTRVEARDNHLKSADFFDAEKYPTMEFKSTSIKKSGKDEYKLVGNLTLHGVTKPVTLELEYNGKVVNPMNKKETAGFEVTGKIKRSDFSIGNGFPEPMLSDEVKIKASGEIIQ